MFLQTSEPSHDKSGSALESPAGHHRNLSTSWSLFATWTWCNMTSTSADTATGYWRNLSRTPSKPLVKSGPCRTASFSLAPSCLTAQSKTMRIFFLFPLTTQGDVEYTILHPSPLVCHRLLSLRIVSRLMMSSHLRIPLWGLDFSEVSSPGMPVSSWLEPCCWFDVLPGRNCYQIMAILLCNGLFHDLWGSFLIAAGLLVALTV